MKRRRPADLSKSRIGHVSANKVRNFFDTPFEAEGGYKAECLNCRASISVGEGKTTTRQREHLAKHHLSIVLAKHPGDPADTSDVADVRPPPPRPPLSSSSSSSSSPLSWLSWNFCFSPVTSALF